MIPYDMQKWIFKQSKRRYGWIYLMRYTDPVRITINTETGERLPIYKWKYGKTKDLKKRLTFYSKDYELVEAWKVNHLSLREMFIHQDWDILQSREENWQDWKDEHVEFDCYDIVKHYAEGEVKIREETYYGIGTTGYIYIGNSEEESRTSRDLHSAMFNLIKII